ncbi:gamma-glutamyltransferase family protein [Acidithiobacillus sp.]|uniref:gamma-glutamyltransferase family protein n=1 Tax=Acidithiobacillus sp. TaxID=1872118 RepID=UPI003D079990
MFTDRTLGNRPVPIQTLSAASEYGVVSAPHGLASQSGLRVLDNGGNAIEAAIAIAATLSVVYPHMTGLGGDAFWLIGNADGSVLGLDGAGTAAQMADPEYYLAAGRQRIPERGPLAANTVAGAVSTWDAAYVYSRERWGGSGNWGDLLDDAVWYAFSGCPVSRGLHLVLTDKLKEMVNATPPFQAVFLANGQAPDIGSTLRQPALGQSLSQLQRSGADDFYRGDLGARMARGLAAQGSPLSVRDLAIFHARWVEPLRCPYGKGELVNLPPPTQGVSSLMLLALMERTGTARMDPFGAEYLHHAVEATKLVFALRDHYIADPDYMAIPINDLLAPGFLDELAGRIDPGMVRPHGDGPGPGDTVWFGVADREGRSVSVIQSLYYEFGSTVMAGDTGIVWQNRGCSFSLDRASANVLAPGKRPFHTLNPAMYIKSGKVHLAYGTMGGEGQPQTQAAIASRVLDHGMSLSTAIGSPRWLLGRTWGDASSSLKLERGYAAEAFHQLKRKGHPVEWAARHSPVFGHAGMIRIGDDGALEAASDPRSDGAALGL